METLVCIAIVGIVAALLTPVFAAVREKARLASSVQNLHQLQLATALYRQEYGGGETGFAHEMGLPSIRAQGSLSLIYDSQPLKGRSPCGLNPTWPTIAKARRTLIYQPEREETYGSVLSWPQAVAAHGDLAWLFQDVNCDFTSSAYDDRHAPHRITVVNLAGSAYSVVRTMNTASDALLKP